jgi:MFS family permease
MTTLMERAAPRKSDMARGRLGKGRRVAILATVCVAVFAINLDTTIVNVALPKLGRQLDASTGTLQWVVDAYNLAFAALVLAGGSVGDRFGRRPALTWGCSASPSPAPVPPWPEERGPWLRAVPSWAARPPSSTRRRFQ